MHTLTNKDLDALAFGASILGSGGGGDPKYELLIAKHYAQKYGPPRLISVNTLADDDLIVPFGFVGAPTICRERFFSGKEFPAMVAAIEHRLGKKPAALMPAEIGGSNALLPCIAASLLAMPIIDGDLMGRAFPELQMMSANLHDISPSPLFLVDCQGNVTIEEVQGNGEAAEAIGRNLAVAMGSSALLAIYLMSAAQARTAIIRNSITKALYYGHAISRANHTTSPTQKLIESTSAQILFTGVISDVDRAIKDGFLRGKARLANGTDHAEILYQNEYLVATVNNSFVATTPDIITIVEQESGRPISAELLRYGQLVNVLKIKAPTVWTSAQGLELVGPRYFGYDTDYLPEKEPACSATP